MELVKPQLDIGMVLSDPQPMLDYYRDVLGLRQLPSAELADDFTQHRFALGGHLLKLNARREPPERQRGGIERAIGMRLLALIVDDYDDVLARLTQHGRRYAELVSDREAPYRVAMTKDPEGTVLELIGLKTPGGKGLRTRVQVGMTVSDVERARDFWGRVMGLEEEPPMKIGGDVGTRYGFVWGKSTLKFWSVPGQPPVQTGEPGKHAGLRFTTALVEDLAAAEAELRERGVPIVQERTEMPGLCWLLFFADPDGNWFELVELTG